MGPFASDLVRLVGSPGRYSLTLSRIAEFAAATGDDAGTAGLVAEFARSAAELTTVGLPSCSAHPGHAKQPAEHCPKQQVQRLAAGSRRGEESSEGIDVGWVHRGTQGETQRRR